MAINALNKLAAEKSDIALQNMDGSPMLDEVNEPVTATCCSPGTKRWQLADASKRRNAVRRVRECNGKFEAATDNSRVDTIEFLCAVIERFNGIEIPGETDQVRAILDHPQLGYILDQLEEKTRNWENFMKASQAPAKSTFVSSPG